MGANDFPLGEAILRAQSIRADRERIARIDAAYRRYLELRGALIHADVLPTNILLVEGRPLRC